MMRQNWKQDLVRNVTPEGGDSPIVGFDDTKRIVEVQGDADVGTIRKIRQLLQLWLVPYEVRQLSRD